MTSPWLDGSILVFAVGIGVQYGSIKRELKSLSHRIASIESMFQLRPKEPDR